MERVGHALGQSDLSQRPLADALRVEDRDLGSALGDIACDREKIALALPRILVAWNTQASGPSNRITLASLASSRRKPTRAW